MEFFENYADDRLKAFCTYCVGWAETKDHVPSRVLLEQPYPNHLPTAPSCSACNASFSLDEEYLACFIEVVIVGSTSDSAKLRPKVREIFEKRPKLKARIDSAMVGSDGPVLWRPELARIESVIRKLALGHVAFELGTVDQDWLMRISFTPAPELTESARAEFEEVPDSDYWGEVGTRALQRMVQTPDFVPSWVMVQPERYRYLVVPTGSPSVRMVLGEYLFCEVDFFEPGDESILLNGEPSKAILPVSKYQLPLALDL